MNITAHTNRALAAKILAAATTYGFTIVLARLMQPAQFGQVAFFLNAAMLLSVAGACGQQMIITRFVPAHLAAGHRQHANMTVTAALRVAAIGTILAYAGALAVSVLLQRKGYLLDISAASLVLGYGLVLAVGLSDLTSHLCRSAQLTQLSLWPKEILWRATAGAVILVIVLASGRASLSVPLLLAILLGVLTLLTLVQARLLTLKSGLRLLSGKYDGPNTAEEAQRRNPFWVTSVSNIFLANADVMIVAAVLGTAEAGFYFAANRLAMLLSFFLTSNNIVIAPALSAAWGAGDLTKARDIACAATLRMTPPTLVLGVAMAVFAPQVLSVFGSEFSSAADVLRILALAAVINAATGPADIALNMTGHDRPAMRISLLSLIFAGLALVVGTLWLGSIGTAAAVLTGTLLRKLMFWDLARRRLSLSCDFFSARRVRRDGVPA